MGAVLPLLALRAFAEVAGHGSVRAAAQAMGVTPGAVSQQVRLLEDRIGIRLFDRHSGGLRLTQAGARAHPQLARAFADIRAVMTEFEATAARKTLKVSTVASFAASWLIPRLGRFAEGFPDVEVKVEATSALADLKRGDADVALRHGLGHYPGLFALPVATPVLVPVASEALLANGPGLRTPEDCLSYPLLQDADHADWAMWLRAHGVKDDPRALRGPSFDDDLLLLRAAQAGQGIALVHDLDAEDEIRRGRLVLALDSPWPSSFAYYAVTTAETARREEVKGFLDWLMREAVGQQPSHRDPALARGQGAATALR